MNVVEHATAKPSGLLLLPLQLLDRILSIDAGS
jgi:hypothetical protein